MKPKYLKATRAGAILALAMGTVVMMANSAMAEPASRSTRPVVSLPSLSVVPGATSTITRTDSGIHATITTNGLPAGAYTVWILVFNDPSVCGGSLCSPPLHIGASNGGVHFGAGHVVSGRGPTNFAVNLAVGDSSGQIAGPSALLDPRGAEIHLAIRSHGPAIPGLVDDQIRTVAGACSGDPAALAGEIGDDGYFKCFEIQAAAHFGE